jgi:hypothetical protein
MPFRPLSVSASDFSSAAQSPQTVQAVQASQFGWQNGAVAPAPGSAILNNQTIHTHTIRFDFNIKRTAYDDRKQAAKGDKGVASFTHNGTVWRCEDGTYFHTFRAISRKDAQTQITYYDPQGVARELDAVPFLSVLGVDMSVFDHQFRYDLNAGEFEAALDDVEVRSMSVFVKVEDIVLGHNPYEHNGVEYLGFQLRRTQVGYNSHSTCCGYALSAELVTQACLAAVRQPGYNPVLLVQAKSSSAAATKLQQKKAAKKAASAASVASTPAAPAVTPEATPVAEAVEEPAVEVPEEVNVSGDDYFSEEPVPVPIPLEELEVEKPVDDLEVAEGYEIESEEDIDISDMDIFNSLSAKPAAPDEVVEAEAEDEDEEEADVVGEDPEVSNDAAPANVTEQADAAPVRDLEI